MFKTLLSSVKRLSVKVRRFIREKRKIYNDEIAFSNAHQLVHFWMLVIQHFHKNRSLSRAASLSFSTILAIVPLVAIVLSISTSVIKSQGSEQIRNYAFKLVESVAPQLKELKVKETGDTEEEQAEEIVNQQIQDTVVEGDMETAEKILVARPDKSDYPAVDQVVDQIMEFVNNVKPGSIGAAGIIALIFITLSLMATVESAFNDIWSQDQGRKWWMRLILYWTVLTLGSILFLAGASLAAASKFGSATLTPEDIEDLPTLVVRLKPHEGQDEVSRYLWSRLEEQDRQKLDEFQASVADDVEVREVLVKEMNSVIEEESISIYSPERFKDVKLREQTIELADEDLEGEGREAFRRMLLEDAYPDELAKSARVVEMINRIPFIGVVIPFFMAMVAFTLFNLTVPNTKVKVSAAVIGGLIGAFLWQANKLGTGFFAGKILREATIYGSFAVVPVVMFGMYLFWLILLFSAQVAYAFQHRQTYMLKRLAERIHFSGREFAAMRIMTCIGRFFQKGKKAPTAAEISKALELPEQLTEEILGTFDHCNLVEISGGENEFGRYLPARALEKISAYDVLMSLREGKGHDLATTNDANRNRVKHELDRIRTAEMEVAKSIRLPRLIGSNSPNRRRRPPRSKPVSENAADNS